MKIVWWFTLCSIVAAAVILLVGMIQQDLIIMFIGAILTGICVILLRGIDGYINTGVWFG